MKKFFSVILAAVSLICIFTSCAFNKKEVDPNEQNETYFKLSQLPDIGKYRSGEIKKYFFSDGAHKQFEPSEKYGGIVPYLCRKADYTTEYWDGSLTYDLYGIATYDGRIITDCIYTSAYPVSDKNGKTIFVCQKEAVVNKKRYDIIAKNGKKLIEAQTDENVEGVIKFYYNLPCECFSAITDNGTVLYDFDGSFIINLTDAFGADCFFHVYYCDSDKIIFSSSPYDDFFADENTKLFCISKYGNLVYTIDLGSYYPLRFEDGYFLLLSKESYEMKIIDIMGNCITGEKTYSDIDYDSKTQCFWCMDMERDNIYKINKNGDELFSQRISHLNQPFMSILNSKNASSVFVYDCNDKTKFVWLNADTCAQIKIDDVEAELVELYYDNKNDYVEFHYDNTVEIYSASGAYLKTIKNVGELKQIYNGKVLYADTNNCLHISGLSVTNDFSLPLTREQQNYFVSFFNVRLLIISYYIEDTCYFTIYDVDSGKALIDRVENANMFETANGVFCCGKINNKLVLINETGKILTAIEDVSML